MRSFRLVLLALLLPFGLAPACTGGDGDHHAPPPGTPSDEAGNDAESSDGGTGDASLDGVFDAADDASHDVADAASEPTPAALRVLFIGNSYTAANDLPAMFKALAGGSPLVLSVETEMVVAGGATLEAHYTGGTAVPKIERGGWSHVVLQGQSVEPCADPANFHDHALKLDAVVDAALSRTVLFQTWPRQEGHEIYTSGWVGSTPDDYMSCLADAYSAAAGAASADLAEVGFAWMAALVERPGYPLFSGDGSHPSVAGTYLAACVFFGALTGATPVGLPYHPPEVTPEDAAWLQAVAAGVVF